MTSVCCYRSVSSAYLDLALTPHCATYIGCSHTRLQVRIFGVGDVLQLYWMLCISGTVFMLHWLHQLILLKNAGRLQKRAALYSLSLYPQESNGIVLERRERKMQAYSPIVVSILNPARRAKYNRGERATQPPYGSDVI